MEDHLSRLEVKVVEAIELIQTLREENRGLEGRCEELEHRLQDVAQERDRLRGQLEEASAAAAEVEQFEQKRRLIEQKVGNLLEKLEAMG
ncbi:cell division protein ZapB [bacterium]|jgi:chaperonin cofactor prefoldin|nr:cell division protein ZapB [bacterium]